MSAGAEIEEWFRDLRASQDKEPKNAFYLCKTKNVAKAVKATFEKGVTMEEESRLLGYPLCCVRDHYRRSEQMETAFYMMIKRTAQGNVDEMKRIVTEDVAVTAATAEEIALLQDGQTFHPAPFTSFHMCSECFSKDGSPAKKLSERYEALAKKVDAGFAGTIEVNAEGVGS